MKTLNVTDQTYEELYRLVVPDLIKQAGANISQNDVVRELVAIYVAYKRRVGVKETK